MKTLANPRHERFCVELASGKTAIAAYKNAGYKPDDGAASRLSGNVKIKARVAELNAARAAKVVERTTFRATELFAIYLDAFEFAKAQGDSQTALKAADSMAKCLGYSESPTLTHEHLNGEAVPILKAPEAPHPNSHEGMNVLRQGRAFGLKLVGK